MAQIIEKNISNYKYVIGKIPLGNEFQIKFPPLKMNSE